MKQHATEHPKGQRRNPKRKKYLETSENGNTANGNGNIIQLVGAKAFLTGKFIAINTHLKKQERPKMNKLTMHLKEVE